MKKGFTLIEMMGVLVIIAVIALITTPIINYIIGEVRENAFKDSLYSIFRSTEYYYKENSYEIIPTKGLDVTSDIITISNNSFVSGKIVEDKNGDLYLKNVTNNVYCGNGYLTNL
ncbi:MAG: prepilin-type N-terminal cleavage/methylation domain-containing protein, partial [Bacilli bacterium]|nr:prepilin-type N-terminal cleavage/methylation domain-containing protein [Bacilli bacterium]